MGLENVETMGFICHLSNSQMVIIRTVYLNVNVKVYARYKTKNSIGF
jgi:rRNA processing protein Gar1